MARELGKEWGIEVRTIRLGPLVDFEMFQAPGRLGRELGRFYIVMGGRRSPLSVCDVGTAAEVILNYVAEFDHAPELLNLVEPHSTFPFGSCKKAENCAGRIFDLYGSPP